MWKNFSKNREHKILQKKKRVPCGQTDKGNCGHNEISNSYPFCKGSWTWMLSMNEG